MNFSRQFNRSTRPTARNSAALAKLEQIRSVVPYLKKRKEILEKDNNCFDRDDLSNINYWLEIAKDVKADLTYDMETLEVTYDQIAEMARKFPNEGAFDEDENEPEEDEDEILGLAEQMKPPAPPTLPPRGILIPGGRGRGSRGGSHTSGLIQTSPEPKSGTSPGFIKITTGFSVGRGRGQRMEGVPAQPGPTSSNGHESCTNSLPRHQNDQRFESESMEFQSRAPDEFNRRSQDLPRQPLTSMEYSDRRVIDYGHREPGNSADFSEGNSASFNETGALGSRFPPACDSLNGSSNFGVCGSDMAQRSTSSNPSQQNFQAHAYPFIPSQPGPSQHFPHNNPQNSQAYPSIRPLDPFPLSNKYASLLGNPGPSVFSNPGPSVFSNPRIPNFQNIRAPDLPLPPRGPQLPSANFPLIAQAPPLMGHMPPTSTWIPNRHLNQNHFNPNQRGFGPRQPSRLLRPHSNPNARGALQPKNRIQARFDNISRTDLSKTQPQHQPQCPPGGNLQPSSSSSSSQPPDTNSINWQSRIQNYFKNQQDKRPGNNGIRLTHPHQVRHRGRGRGNSRGGPATRGRRPAPPSQAKNLPNQPATHEDPKETEESTSPPSAKKRQAAVQTAEDRQKNQILNRVRANLDKDLPQRSKESKLAQMRKEFAQNEVYRLGFKNKDNTIQKGPVEKLPEPVDEDPTIKSASRSRSRSVSRARSRSKSVARDSKEQSGSLSPKKRPPRRVNYDDEEDAENQDQEDRNENETTEEDPNDRGDFNEDEEDDTEPQGEDLDAENDSHDMTEHEDTQSRVPQVSDETHFLSLARNLLVETGVSAEDIEKVLSNPYQKKEILAAIQEALTARPTNDTTSNGQGESLGNNVDMSQPPRPESTCSSAASTLSESSSADSTSSKKRKKDENNHRNDTTEDAPSPPPKSPPPKKRPTQSSSAPKTKSKNSNKKVRSGRQEIPVLKAPEIPIHVGITKIKVEQDYIAVQRIKQEPVHRDQHCDDSD